MSTNFQKMQTYLQTQQHLIGHRKGSIGQEWLQEGIRKLDTKGYLLLWLWLSVQKWCMSVSFKLCASDIIFIASCTSIKLLLLRLFGESLFYFQSTMPINVGQFNNRTLTILSWLLPPPWTLVSVGFKVAHFLFLPSYCKTFLLLFFVLPIFTLPLVASSRRQLTLLGFVNSRVCL